MKTIVCQSDQRREVVRAKTKLNGLDYLEVSDDQLTLKVYFLGKAPPRLSQDNFKIEGGRRVRDIRILSAKTFRNPDETLDDTVKLRLERYGDFSTYTLRLVNVAEPIDPYYDHLDFTFKISCPSDLDCKAEDLCPPEVRQEPEVNYLAKDYASFRQLILDRLALVMPDWQERHVPDLGVALAEVLAYTGDYLSYYQDAVATEAYLDTARQRISVRRHARLVDYRMHEGCNARAWVCLQVTGAVTLDPADIFFVAGLKEAMQIDKCVLARDDLRKLPPHSFLAYEPLLADRLKRLEFYEEHNRISFYTWGERSCCVPKGATRATLRDGWANEEAAAAEQEAPKALRKPATAYPEVQERARKLRLKTGDVLIFEEVLGPKTGDSADSDPNHRHAVRLTKVEPGIDPLDGTPTLEIEWSPDDALPFALCLSARSDAEHGCVYSSDVSVARGNVVLVDHGLTGGEPETPVPGEVPVLATQAECFCDGRPGDVALIPGRYRPTLAKSLLTYSQPVDFNGPAAKVMRQSPAAALPLVKLTSRRQSGSKVLETEWESRLDLIESSGYEAHFVVEVDNEGVAHLRFGDGDCGRRPEAGMTFAAHYRVGNGKAGNAGPEAITYLVYGKEKPDGIAVIRNPLPADGGVDPEPIKEVKLLAPSTFRTQLQRAITAADYARIAERHPKVQRAGAVLRWNGSWYEAQVAIDPQGSEQASEALLKEVEDYLYPFRRMGHDLRVVPAHYVSLDIAMDICVQPEYLRGHVKAALLKLFSDRILENGKRGFFHPDNLSFGDGIFASRLIAVAVEVEGVESAQVTRLVRQFEKPKQELEQGVLPLRAQEIARCDNDPDYPEHGKFELNLRGGR